LWEHKFLARIDAAANSDWFNKSNGAGKFHTTSESEESRLSARNARTPEQKKKPIKWLKQINKCLLEKKYQT
jgi:hypothetical protein